ncbi:hypothetical protein A0H81_01966 [Grifola frondosa]|uniref:Uncharacterized protein n=1 Tax=Grifola frondosa TaxID=5627 RepID=A0A1C7MP34_GRIFR|nr:hypothetical protein A0H81_01966 [Grifola frondosa]
MWKSKPHAPSTTSGQVFNPEVFDHHFKCFVADEGITMKTTESDEHFRATIEVSMIPTGSGSVRRRSWPIPQSNLHIIRNPRHITAGWKC